MNELEKMKENVIESHISDLINYCIAYKSLSKSFQFSANRNMETEVNAILADLKKDIFNIIYLRAEYANNLAFHKEGKEDSNIFLVSLISSHIVEKTLDERINRYVSLLRSEVEAYLAAGIAKDMSAHQIATYYFNWLKQPYKSPLLLQAFRQKGFKAVRIVARGISFGKGNYTSAFNNLLRLEQQTIFHAYNYALNNLWILDNKVIGWYSVRGSNYPCSICDENIGVFHPKEDFFWGYHLRCCCIMIPVYSADLL